MIGINLEWRNKNKSTINYEFGKHWLDQSKQQRCQILQRRRKERKGRGKEEVRVADGRRWKRKKI